MKGTLDTTAIAVIEAYLIKNKVKFWDVRQELIDHIATQIEELMVKGVSFEQALQTTHQSFGNKLTFGTMNNEGKHWMQKKSVYADNAGFKKLIQEKQQEIYKGIRKKIGVETKLLLKQPLFLLVYLTAMALIFYLMQNPSTISVVWIILFGVLTIPVLFSMGYTIKLWIYKARNLKVETLFSFSFLGINLFNFLIHLPRLFEATPSKWIAFGMASIAIPFTYVFIKLSRIFALAQYKTL